MSATAACPKCGVDLPPDAPAGLCPQCLVAAGLESEAPGDAPLDPTSPSPGAAGFEPPPVDRMTTLFPQLEILELVGKGGMGAVYKARQPGLDRLVAVKILPPEIGRDPAFAERFTREARAMARLSHPNIVSIYDFGQTDGLYFFVMEFVDGVNLRQTMQAGRLKPEEALAIVPQICDALQYAHDEGVVHRDIKPENVLIDKRGRVKIADFGLSKLMTSQGRELPDLSLTGTRQVMGTLRYMAPEQMQGTKAVDHRADIYSLGVVFYELLTGDVPMGRFAPPSEKARTDARLDDVVLRALDQEPDKRYQQASEVKNDVESLARTPPVAPVLKPLNPTPDELDAEAALQELKIPAIGLMVVGILMCLMSLSPILVIGVGSMFWAMKVEEYDAPNVPQPGRPPDPLPLPRAAEVSLDPEPLRSDSTPASEAASLPADPPLDSAERQTSDSHDNQSRGRKP